MGGRRRRQRAHHAIVIAVIVIVNAVIGYLQEANGESTENPFEGGANDVPISMLCCSIEIDLREMMGETELPPILQPKSNIAL